MSLWPYFTVWILFNDLKLNIDADLNKTRDEYRRMKAENEKLIVRNDTLFKLGNIALEQNKNKTKSNSESNDDENIEVIFNFRTK